MSNTEALRTAAEAALDTLDRYEAESAVADALRAALAQPAASGEPLTKHCEWTNCPTRVGNTCCNGRVTAQPAPARAPVLTQELIREARQDAVEVFDAEGPETPQIVRDVIEYMASWLVVYADKAGNPAKEAP